jgi:hypothetical protein
VALVACGALAQPAALIAAATGWPLDVHPLPPLLHNSPREIAPQVRALVERLTPAYDRIVVGYADCGTYGALDDVCARLGLRRLPGLHCYDVFAGPGRVRELFEAEPGTYLLTDFLVRSFDRTVLAGLGLDRYPELWPDYFGHYRRVVWLAQDRTAELQAEAERVAARFGLPLTIVETGLTQLERELERLVTAETLSNLSGMGASVAYMDEFRARRVVDALRDRGVNAHLLRAGVGQYGISVTLTGGRTAEWDTDGTAGLEAQVMRDGMLVGFVPQLEGSEDFDEAQTVDAIARTDYDQPIARQRATAPPAAPLPREGGVFRRFLDGFRYR